jgi:hypothetical protein
LREHLEALAIERGLDGKAVADVEEHDLAKTDALLPLVDDARSADVAIPLADEADGRRR